MAETVVTVRAWKDVKASLVSHIKESPKTSFISQKDVTVSGQPALEIFHESSVAKVKTFYVNAGLDIFAITFEAPPQEFSKYEDVFNEMLSSFSFKKEYVIKDPATIFSNKVQEQIARK